ncbi:unnamed protein product [Cylindrotheca closterium]|uniref:DUF6824 domain-containing protein n=1 Tax=Cylindrotheca closterium TaxID=2856 RepID=A0AAD2PUS5_9STRA|nr:unnamed protein product [Cylindrotheca closterium]
MSTEQQTKKGQQAYSIKPSTRNAITKLTYFDQYTALRNHRMSFQDAVDINAERVDKASQQDVIFGRGKSLQDHPGNQRMRQITNKYNNLYRTLPKSQKRDLVETVYKEIVNNGARFLTKAPNTTHYLLVDVEVALQKISNSLRCMKKHKRQLLLAAMERRNSPKAVVSKAFMSTAASSLTPEPTSSRHQVTHRFDGDQPPSKKVLKGVNAARLLSSNLIPGPRDLGMLTTLQHLNQYTYLRSMIGARMTSFVATGRSIRQPSSKLSMPTKRAQGSTSNPG